MSGLLRAFRRMLLRIALPGELTKLSIKNGDILVLCAPKDAPYKSELAHDIWSVISDCMKMRDFDAIAFVVMPPDAVLEQLPPEAREQLAVALSRTAPTQPPPGMRH